MTTLNQKPTLEEALAHYGVLGMKWGVRKDRSGDSARPAGVSRSTNRAAKSDAKEFSKAKMFYGEGAGTRRKLIKAKVETRSKRDPMYKKAFDHHLSRQDMGKRAAGARRERGRKDAVNTTKKTARGIKNLALNTGAPVTITALLAYKAYNNPEVKAAVNKFGKQSLDVAKSSYASNERAIQDLLKKINVR